MHDVFATARQAGFATQSWRARELALLAQTLGAALQARKAMKGDSHSQARATMPASCATRGRERPPPIKPTQKRLSAKSPILEDHCGAPYRSNFREISA